MFIIYWLYKAIFFRFSLIKEYHFPNSKYIILQFILQIMYCKLCFEIDRRVITLFFLLKNYLENLNTIKNKK